MTARNGPQFITLRPEILAATIAAHGRVWMGGCACGYAEWGASHAEHVVSEAVLANRRAGYALRTLRAHPEESREDRAKRVESREQRDARRALKRARRVDP